MSDISRRAIVGTGLLAVGAAGIGVGVATGSGSSGAQKRTSGEQHGVDGAPLQNSVLIAAIERESALLDRLDRAVAANPVLAAAATVLQADHRAHRQALQALLLPTGGPGAASTAGTSPAATSSGSRPAAAVSSTADLKRQESAAASAAARDCTTASAQLAPLLASISACEASHAAWLT